MEKSRIKQLVRESLLSASKVEEEINEDELNEEDVNEEKIKDYSDIKNALDKPLSPSEVGLYTAMNGKKPDDTDRSLFNKKLHQKKNDDGSTYQLSDEEADKARTALKIK